MPSVRIQDNMQLPPNTYVIKVKEIEVGIAEARFLSITTGEKKEQERLVWQKTLG
jgi:flagellar biosynthesis component FlhA